VDRAVPVLKVESPDGRCRALLFGCACHPVTLDGNNRKLSGDYAGAAQHEIERRCSGVQAMFLPGCGGDANPHPRGGPDQEALVRRQGEQLATEVLRVAESGLPALDGSLQAQLRWVDLPLEHDLPQDRLEELARRSSWHARSVRAMLEQRSRGEPLPTSYRAPLAVWRIGSQLTLVCLPGEAVADYVPRIESAVGQRGLWVAAYGNESFGYLPTRQILADGGHESMCLTLDTGLFSAEVEEVVVTVVKELMR
jgi:hypothetical protein